MKKKMQVVTRWDPLNVRTGPGMNYRVLHTIPKHSYVIAHEEKHGWYKHDHGGWSCGRYLKLIKDLDPPKTKPVHNSKDKDKDPFGKDHPDGYDISEEDILHMRQFSDAKPGDPFDELRVCHALPFQFLPDTDPRPAKCAYGRKFLETMIQDGSFLYIIPGRPEFFTELKNSSKKNVVKGLLGGINESDLTKIVNDLGGRYYTFASDFVNYQGYVNAMCRVGAIYMGLGDVKGYDSNTKYDKFDWGIKGSNKKDNTDFVGNFIHNPIYKEMAQNPCACFYIDGASTSASESVTNSAEPSMITGILNKGSDATREVRFLFGGMAKTPDQKLVDASMTNVESVISGLVSSFTTPVVTRQFIDMGKAVVYGGNVLIPDIWKDSNYNKSYNIELKLVSPYADLESIYLHILVPLFHIMAFCFPRQLGRSGYMSPFIIRGFCKGWFNCDMGIVESFQVKKASQDGWNTNGIPTELDVSLSIRDLYSSIGISSANDRSYLKNTEFLDMIGALCGVNVNKPSIDRKLMLIKGFLTSKPSDVFHNVTRSIQESIRNKINNMLT